MAITLYGIKGCDTVRKARAWLESRGIDYRFHDYKTESIERDRLERWCRTVGWEALLNRTGTTFRKLSDRRKQVAGAEAAMALMLDQPSIIRRPVLESEDGLLVGFRPETYAHAVSAR